jgi:hypothetical protein
MPLPLQLVRYVLTNASELALELGGVNGRSQAAWRVSLRVLFEVGPRRVWRAAGIAGGLLVHAAIIDSLVGLGIFPT